MQRPPYFSRESDPKTYPGRPVEALDSGWNVQVDRSTVPQQRDEFGRQVYMTSKSSAQLEIMATVGKIAIESTAWAQTAWTDETDDQVWGWDAVKAVIELAREATRNSIRVRVRDLPRSDGDNFGLAVAEVSLKSVVKKGHSFIVARGVLHVVRLPSVNILDLTREHFDASGAIITFGADEDAFGVSLRNASDLGIDVIAGLVRRPEVEGFAGGNYNPNLLIDDVQNQTEGKHVYVALHSGRPFGFVTLTRRPGRIAQMCFIIADAELRGQHLADSIFQLGLARAWTAGFMTVVGRTKPPCYMADSIKRAQGTVSNASDGWLDWRVDFRNEDANDV